MGDEILEVNGRTLENATHNEVIQYIHQVIAFYTYILQYILDYIIYMFGVIIWYNLSFIHIFK